MASDRSWMPRWPYARCFGTSRKAEGGRSSMRIGVRPVLADQRNALAHGTPDLRHQLAEPLAQALVGKTAASKLAIKPCVRPPVHWHRSPRDSVPDKESRPIPVTQQFVRSLSAFD